MPLDPVVAAIPNGVPVVSASDSGVAPLHEVVRRLQTWLGNWEGIILPKAEQSLMRHKWRGMGVIQHKGKQVRETWVAALSWLRRKVLDEHSVSLGLLYTEATRSIRESRLRPPGQPLSAEHWLACEDIAHLWKTLMHGAALDLDHPVGYEIVLEHTLHVQRGYDTAGARPGPGMEDDRRCHYVIVNSTKSNGGGNHLGFGPMGWTVPPRQCHPH